MYKITVLQHAEEPPLDIFARYMIGPFLNGQAFSLGSILRHVMLSELTGFAIIGARIKNVQHEFSFLPNIREDITDILLNLKEIVFTTDDRFDLKKGFVVGKIKYTGGPGFLTSQDIILPEGLRVVDSNQYVAELTSDGEFELDLLISQGIGYALSSSFEDMLPDYFLGVDAIFMPVINASFLIETGSSSVESLIFDIRTNGSLLPDEAITCAAEIIIRSFEKLLLSEVPNILTLEALHSSQKERTLDIDFASSELQVPDSCENITEIDETETQPSEDEEENLELQSLEHAILDQIFILNLDLGSRVINALTKSNILTLEQLANTSKSRILQIKGLGKKSVKILEEQLSSFNLRFK
jgi:DNA-directed RNA polymerase subunit alpha